MRFSVHALKRPNAMSIQRVQTAHHSWDRSSSGPRAAQARHELADSCCATCQ